MTDRDRSFADLSSFLSRKKTPSARADGGVTKPIPSIFWFVQAGSYKLESAIFLPLRCAWASERSGI